MQYSKESSIHMQKEVGVKYCNVRFELEKRVHFATDGQKKNDFLNVKRGH